MVVDAEKRDLVDCFNKRQGVRRNGNNIIAVRRRDRMMCRMSLSGGVARNVQPTPN